MRKIDKSEQLSTAYKEWEKDYEDNKKPHPRYNSSKGKYYDDIVMDALRCQNGLCAYTEVQLCPLEYLTPENWKNGRHKEMKEKVYNGDLEHFDERLKFKVKDKEAIEPNNGEKIIYEKKDWLWSNFFVIESNTNNRKSTKAVDYILKPDSVHYDPFKLMEYSNELHIYRAKSCLPEADKKRINDMIKTLGLNFPNLYNRRGTIVKHIIENSLTGDGANEFPTAVEFYKKSQNTEGYIK
jgi:hypothetical protein